MFKGIRQVRLMKAAVRNFQLGETQWLQNIYDYYATDPIFSSVLRQFNATPEDIRSIVLGCAAAGTGTYRGHFVPISAVLYPLTLSYMLRMRRGEIAPAQAHYEVDKYFESGAIVFEPEVAIRRKISVV